MSDCAHWYDIFPDILPGAFRLYLMRCLVRLYFALSKVHTRRLFRPKLRRLGKPIYYLIHAAWCTICRHQAVNVAWNATYRVNKLDRSQWERIVFAQVKSFQRRTMWSIKRGYDGKEYGIQAQWTFTGAFLYR